MPILTVSQVAQHLKETLERDPAMTDVWISGEVSNMTRAQTGHLYFTLKDGESQLRCIMFKGSGGGEFLAQGGLIVAHGRVTYYGPRGTVDFITDIVMPEGTGPQHLELERLRASLEAEGLFEPSRKRLLPDFPKIIGVVTSPSGAVIQDIRKVIGRRYPLVELLLAPSPVQGENAAPSIVAALHALNAEGRANVIILARGGGSQEELWPFNQESVARAIYSSAIPVVSAVGHERDFTIADQVADVRAPTPSAAAEMVVPDGVVLRQDVAACRERAISAFTSNLREQHYELDVASARLSRAMPDLDTLRRRVDDHIRTASTALVTRLNLIAEQLKSMESQMRTLNPVAILNRGYAVVEKQHPRQLVIYTKQVGPEETLDIRVSDGTFPATGRPHQTRRARRPAPVYARKRLL